MSFTPEFPFSVERCVIASSNPSKYSMHVGNLYLSIISCFAFLSIITVLVSFASLIGNSLLVFVVAYSVSMIIFIRAFSTGFKRS